MLKVDFNQFNALIYTFFALFTVCLSVEVQRPRGVSLTKKVFYSPGVDFTCIDGSAVIPYLYVNDDYCDCKDGSDEPGTPACPNGVFHCTNAGFKPMNIPSSRVNDGICDCCDASDEYNSSAQCVNNCREIGRKAREEQLRLAEIASKGYQLRLDLSKQGKQDKMEKQQLLDELLKQKEEADAVKTDKEATKSSAEELEKVALDKFKSEEEEKRKAEEEKTKSEENELEAQNAFVDLDTNQDGKVSIDEIKAKWVFDSDKDGVITDEEAHFFLNQQDEMDRETFLTTGWMLMKPHYSMLKLFKPPEASSETDANQEEPETEAKPEDDGTEEPGGEEDDEDLEEDDDQKSAEGPEKDAETVESAQQPQYDEETQRLVEAADYEDQLTIMAKTKQMDAFL